MRSPRVGKRRGLPPGPSILYKWVAVPRRPTDAETLEPAPAPRRRWLWWRRILVGAGVLLLLLVVLYQPIIVLAVRLLAPGLAAKQGLKLNDFKLGGSILGGLRVENLRVSPTRPGLVEKANVGRLELHYSLPTLIRHGLNSAFIESVTLHDVDVVLDPSKSPPSPPKKKEPFSLPPLPLPGKLSLRNVNFLLRPDTPEGARAAGQRAAASAYVPAPAAPAVAGATAAVGQQGLLINNANLELDPAQNGELRITELRIPAGPDLRDISAHTSYRQRNLQLTDLRLAPDIFFRHLSIDGSKLSQELLAVSLDADLFKGRVNAMVSTQGIGKPPRARVQLDVKGLQFPSLRDFLDVQAPVEGTLDKLSVRFDGNTNQPKTWTGQVEMRIDKPNAGGTALDAATLSATLLDGTVTLENTGASQGENKVALAARIFLTDQMADLPKATGRGTLEIAAPDFTKLPVKLPQEITGGLKAGGDFALKDGRLSTKLKGHVQALAIPAQRLAVDSLDFALDNTKVLPSDATAPPTAPGAPPPPHLPFYDKLQTHTALNVDGIRFADYAVDSVKLVLSSDEAAVKLDQVEILRGRNSVNVDGTYVIPEDFARAAQQPVDLHLDVNVPDLNGFALDPKNPPLPLKGQLTAKGNVTSRHGTLGGGLDLRARDVQAKGATVQTADVQIGIQNDHAVVKTGRIVLDDKNHVDLRGDAGLQTPFPFDAGLTVDLADLSKLNPVLAANGVNQPLGGSVKITGDAKGHLASAPDANDQKIDGSLNIAARDLTAQGVKLQSTDVQVDVADNRAVIKTGQVRFDAKTGLTFGGQADLATPNAFDVNLDGEVPDLGVFAPLIETGEQKQKVAGSVKLTGQFKGHLATAPDANDTEINGGLQLTGRSLEAKGAKIDAVSGDIVADGTKLVVKTLQVKVDGNNILDVTGQAGLRAPYAYQAGIDANLRDLSAFQPLLRATPAERVQAQTSGKAARIEAASKASTPPVNEVNGPKATEPGKRRTLVTKTSTSAGPVTVAVQGAPDQPGTAAYVGPGGSGTPEAAEPKLAGAFELHWQARGDFAAPEAGGKKFAGGGTMAAHKVVFNALGPLEADIQGKYAQQVIEFPVLYVGTNGLEFRSTIALKDALARIDKISLKQGATELLAGYIQVPLDLNQLSDPGGPIPDVDKIDVNVASKPLAIETLLNSFDKNAKVASPLRGNVGLEITAHGSLSKLVAETKLAARGVHSTDLPTVRPVDADVGIFFKDNRLSLDTSVRQPQIQPLTIKGNVPLNLREVAEKKSVDPNSPVTLTLSLPRTGLGFLAGATKALRFIEGTAAADVRVNGTIGKPAFAGTVDLSIPAARAENITVPAVRDFAARLAFTTTELRIERFSGEIGGGKLDAGGRVGFAKLTEPTLDIFAKANNVLAVRDDNITARVNADLKLTGPLAAASVTGYVGITKSRYLKDIDILPIGSPGKPAPAPPAEADSSSPASIGISSAPVKDWKFNVGIRTDDPFVVRGNVANGTALADLHLRGTGAKLLLDGNVNVQNLVASLPFSKLTISDGNVNFTPDQPLDPLLNLTGTSQVRNYLVTVLISGRSRDPKITFISDPPLGQEQIVSLLATGATTDELAGNAQALAGKATLLVVQDLYRRTFKKKTSSRAEPQSSLADRVDINLGDTDPATGKQQVGAGFKVTDNVQFIADLGIQGDLRGRLKYLVRFR